jgi:hypothetical protein
MTHKMILATADLSTIYKVVVARRKNAGMAEEAMHRPRKADYSCSTQDTSPSFEEDDRQGE